jgi:hypothetical protein
MQGLVSPLSARERVGAASSFAAVCAVAEMERPMVSIIANVARRVRLVSMIFFIGLDPTMRSNISRRLRENLSYALMSAS